MSRFYEYKELPVKDLIPYAQNSRTHSEEQINQVASSIKEFNFTNPVLVDEQGGIIAGHGRTLAAKKLGMESVPCIVMSGLTEAQKKAYVIADNQLALNSGWDLDMLRLEVETLQEMDFDIDLLGLGDFLAGDLDDDYQDPELKEEDYCEKFNVIIECADEHQQEIVYKKMQAEGYVCQVQSL